MKDQVALLRWVKKNIASFGGNPSDITLSGYSAGSSAVELLMLSKMTEGLFNKVILESGSGVSPISFQIDPIQSAKGYSKLIGSNDIDDLYELEYFFKSAPYEILQSGNTIHQNNNSVILLPCVERDFGQEMFLEDSPVNIIRKGNFSKLPVLNGFAEMEGLLRIPHFNFWTKDMNGNFADFLPSDLYFKSKEEKVLVANTIKQFYFGNNAVDDSSVLEYVEYFSQSLFVCLSLRIIDHLLNAGHDQIYLYQYSYTDENTPYVPYTNIQGATHCDQSTIIGAQFNVNIYSKHKVTKEYKKMQKIMRELWTNFINNGKPEASGAPVWPPVGKNGSPHMILKKFPELGGSLLAERCSFWDKIYESYYNFPLPPSSPLQRNEL